MLKIAFGYFSRLPGLQEALENYNESEKYVDWEIAVRKGYRRETESEESDEDYLDDESSGSDEEIEPGESDDEWTDIDD